MRLDADWLRSDNTRAVMAALEAAKPGCARFVGGCVRNTLMNRVVDDIDIATQLVPDEIISALETAGITAIPTGYEHGTITAVRNSQPFEITSLRRDVETDGRRAVVAFSQDWNEDARRRDFRLNAIYASPDGTLYDPSGAGVDDALAGRVIFIGDADQRLREDYLRSLRFFRFNAHYGAGLDPEGLAACARQASGLKQIAVERIWKEFEKLLRAPEPEAALEGMVSTGTLEMFWPMPEEGLRLVSSLVRLERALGRAPDSLLRAGALLPRDADIITRTAKHLHLSNAEAARLSGAAAPALKPVTTFDARALRRALYIHGTDAVRDAYLLAIAASEEAVGTADIRKRLADIEDWAHPSLPVRGGDFQALGLKGKAIGEAMREAEQAFIDSDFSLSRDALLSLRKQ